MGPPRIGIGCGPRAAPILRGFAPGPARHGAKLAGRHAFRAPGRAARATHAGPRGSQGLPRRPRP
ncbi:hypothetical protein ISF6_2934 [Piscinibacter sakaiensis]|uniref:Uncharacterized protein n=1 Tax=Piscinibacter sakaiensis TaxID=1547922 RepID=A0A0K8P3E5_PISS1|nr:hypothetical protein ISF6_2934 [Piscinibacter sakaiensis]